MTRETEQLFAAVLVEALRLLRRVDRDLEDDDVERRRDAYLNREWGYPRPARRRWR
jgi:hypothetical protein